MKKRILSVLLCAVMLGTLIPATALSASAAVEGDWTTYRFANEYCDEHCEHVDNDSDDEHYYRPAAGYKYTSEGFTVVPADYTDTTPQLSVMSKEAQSVKGGIYLRFRVDDFSYDGGQDCDEWIALTLTTEYKVEPGSVKHGGGWMALIRGKGDGICSVEPLLTDPATDDFGGTFVNVGTGGGAIERDNQGREIYTLEITWDGSLYEMKLNGTVIPGSNETTALLEKLNPNGEFFVGINMHSAVKDGTAAVTILKYGTSEANATTPVGDDRKESEENIACGIPDMDPDMVPDNQPAILWNPETVSMKSGHNCSFTVQGDNTWRVQATEADLFFNFTPKRTWAFNAEDFPVFGILLRNFWIDSGTLWYSAGEYVEPTQSCRVSFSVYDGKFYGEDKEYVFVPVDLSDLWEGRIHNIRLDVFIADESASSFDICFAGMFRSEEEAYAYAANWLSYDNPVPDTCPVHPGQSCECALTEPSTETPVEPPYEPAPETEIPIWETIPEEAITEVVSMVEDALDTEEGETVDAEAAVEDILAKYGCTGTVGACVALIPILAAYVLKKKE